ncbi:DUF2306 domain-containing protein [Fibrella aquatilis]|uniref:DUF2306 domain-containing protein n=1 Tax=Fibrella aquatilis TaxID=2817059 RepID=A0A939K255_9BACT|nr:DUF2306 domain-containing protein [Fibrella aquatilis]MBO0934208.1 hypothetical protein [Fibrella aquatilis]
MTNFIHSTVGAVHLGAALLSLLFGTGVFALPKATRLHKQVGYGYVAAMVVLNGTAFMIYHLFGKFGPFHYLALFSSLSIVAGMAPVVLKKPTDGWLIMHYQFMNWSVVGLYAAFWAETLTRTLPIRQFWPIVIAATTVTMIIGSYFIRKHQKRLLAMR